MGVKAHIAILIKLLEKVKMEPSLKMARNSAKHISGGKQLQAGKLEQCR